MHSPVSFREFTGVWVRVALLSFGGPAAQIAVMHRILVDEKRWIEEGRFLKCLNFCMLLPGPEAQQLATYIGWLMHGVRGGLTAGLLFILPGFVSILGLSLCYVTMAGTPSVEAVLTGLRSAVLAVVAEAVLRVARRVIHSRVLAGIAVAAFLLIWLRILPFPAVIGLAGIAGLLCQWWNAQLLGPPRPVPASQSLPVLPDPSGQEFRHPWRRALVVSVIFLSLWFGPVIAIACRSTADNVFLQLGEFFSKTAVVTFGGAYAVLSYVDQQAVETYGWLTKAEMADGLGLAESTPGPLIMVVQFVGFVAAWRHSADAPSILAGVQGSVLTTWVTFVPCFYWIFLFAPFVERLLARKALASALTAITASVVGAIAALGVNLAISTLFREQVLHTTSLTRCQLPVVTTLRWETCLIAAVAAVLLLRLHRGLAVTLAVCVALGGLLTALKGLF